ncbi:UDP-glucuronosyltransferase 2B31-like [Patiria miniata]|uniref:Uncharacterized protein n=1 Tax=Patiria miniata TaxID=46514 RepID=A0A913ZMK6_PATMI|nr:UDP-glucuronosyltransferase 2B31-like [Patiria miniata]
MATTMSAVLLLFLTVFSSVFVLPALTSDDAGNKPGADKYKFLYFASITGGSHYFNLVASGRVLARQGHRVVSLVSSSNPTSHWEKDSSLFSFVVFNSSWTKQNRSDATDSLSASVLTGSLNHFWGHLLLDPVTRRKLDADGMMQMWRDECADLFADSASMKRLREEKFDMLVGDEFIACSPMLAQALDIPFVLNSVFFAIPSRHAMWSGLPLAPSYVPERAMGLTDRMTFLQRVQNVLGHFYLGNILFPLGSCNFKVFDKLKVKYNIKPEISTLESHKQALLYFMHGSFGLEFPRPMNPNTIYVLYNGGLDPNQTLDKEVAKFLDSAPDGVLLFSLGSNVRMLGPKQAQIFADAFNMLPHRVLWQSGADLTALKLGENTMVAKWLPLTYVMEQPNVRAYLSHAASFSMNEAMWAGLPMVGLPLFEEQMDDMVRVESRGAGLTLDITTITPETLSHAIRRVMTEPGFRKNAQHVSQIMRDLQNTPSPADNVARWILHVTRFGGEHLRPAVLDLNFVQRNLLDVYLFLAVALASVIFVNLAVCRLCCRCLCRRGRSGHFKKE